MLVFASVYWCKNLFFGASNLMFSLLSNKWCPVDCNTFKIACQIDLFIWCRTIIIFCVCCTDSSLFTIMRLYCHFMLQFTYNSWTFPLPSSTVFFCWASELQDCIQALRISVFLGWSWQWWGEYLAIPQSKILIWSILSVMRRWNYLVWTAYENSWCGFTNILPWLCLGTLYLLYHFCCK